MYLIFSRFCRPPLRCYSVHYRIVVILTTNSSPECTQATSPLSYSNGPLKSHPSSKENLALYLLEFLTNNWNKVLHRSLLAYFAQRCDCTTDRFWRKLKAEAAPHCSTLKTTMPNNHDRQHTFWGSTVSSISSLTLTNVNGKKHPRTHWTISRYWDAGRIIFGLPSKVVRIPHQCFPQHTQHCTEQHCI